SVVGAAIIIGSMLGTAAIAGGTAANVQEEGKMICIGHHRVTLPSSAKATVVATYLGMGVKDEGPAEWGRIESSLQGRAERLQSVASPRTARAEAIYSAAGGDPEKAFADSGLVGFDVTGKQAIIAEHINRSSEFAFEAHRLY